MFYKADFQGKLFIDEKLEGESVSVFLTEETLILSKAAGHLSKTKIYISPFNKFMVFVQNPKLMKEGFYYEVKGTDLGSISVGPLGHPGDGEYDIRPVTAFRLEVNYSLDCIKIDVKGTTTTGTDGFDANKTLSPWKFSAHFEIPKERLQEFFGLPDFVKSNVFKLFDDVFGVV